MTFWETYIDDQTATAATHEGYQWQYRFPNQFGASVIRHDYGPRAGGWEVCPLQWHGDEPRAAATVTGRPDQAIVFYPETAEGVAYFLQELRDSPGPTGLVVDWVVPR